MIEKTKTKKIFLEALKFVGLFLIILGIVYLAVNSPAIYQKIKYKLKKINLSQRDNFILSEETIPEEDRLVIPKIDVDAPIIFLESTEEEEIMEDLKQGVVLLLDTALPGEKGNCVITGHSSNFWWQEGDYNTIFVLLDELESNDLIIIYYEGEKFIYKVFDKKVVSPLDLNILSQKTEDAFLTLFSCWPIGSDLKRMVIKSELVE